MMRTMRGVEKRYSHVSARLAVSGNTAGPNMERGAQATGAHSGADQGNAHAVVVY
jgi:hypothetical protein